MSFDFRFLITMFEISLLPALHVSWGEGASEMSEDENVFALISFGFLMFVFCIYFKREAQE
jgi:hypothetical protein